MITCRYLVDHPQLTDDMYKLTFFKVKGETVSSDYEPINFVCKLTTMIELKLRHDVMFGDIFVFDCKGFTFNVALRITPMLVYKTFVLLYDVNQKKPYVTNVNTGILILGSCLITCQSYTPDKCGATNS